MPLDTIDPAQNAHLQQFVAEIAALFDSRKPETFWDCEASFRRLAASSAVADIAEQSVRRMLASPLDAPARWSTQRLALLKAADYSVVAIWHGQTPEGYEPTLSTQGGHAFVYSLSPHPFRVRFLSLGTVDFACFDPTLRLEPDHEVILRPGETLAIDGSKWVLELEQRPDICMLVFVTRPLWSHMWTFDPETLRPWHISHSELQLSQLRSAMSVFRALGYAPARSAVQALTHHPVHDVRWEAVKTLASLDATAAIDALREASADSHPHVRAAARKSLALLDADARSAMEAP